MAARTISPAGTLRVSQSRLARGRYSTLIASFVANDLKTRYVGSFMGFYWTFVSPLVDLVTYTFVFAIVLRVQFAPGYSTALNALFLFGGMLPWLTISESITRSVNIVRENGHLIRKVHFPPVVLPAYIIVSEAVGQVIRLGILLAAAWTLGVGLSWHVIFVPLILVIQTVFVLGLSLMLSCAQVFFRDVSEFTKATLKIWMFVTPIFYPARLFPEQLAPILLLNPLSLMVAMYRDTILNHQLPHLGSLLLMTVYALLSCALGLWVFHRQSYRFADLV